MRYPRPMPAPLDLLCIGESLRDVFYLLDEASVTCSLHKERCLLCLEYAEKIPVKHIVKVHAAGNSANVAVGARRLGLRSGLVSWIGQDAAGADILSALRQAKIDTQGIHIDPHIPTSEATLLVFQGERTQLVHFEPREYLLPPLPATKAAYYSAMGWKFADVDRRLLAHLKKHPGMRLAFQPGTTHIRAGLKAILPLIARSWLLVLNKDEAAHLLNDGHRPMRNLLESLHRHGAQTVVITDGPNGADAFDGERHWHMPIFPGEAIERTGAGDSFACAVTCALLRGEDLPTALRWGAANSWSVVMKVGPQAGLLTSAGLSALLRKFAKIRPVAITL